MFALKENLPIVIGVIIVGVVVWLLWRDLANMRKTLTTVVNEHNQTASILDQHKKAINAMTMPLMDAEYEYEDDGEEDTGEIEEIVDDVLPKTSKAAKKAA